MKTNPLKTLAILIICSFVLMGGKCEWFPDDEESTTPAPTVEIIDAKTTATVQSIDTVNNEMVVKTTGGKEFTVDLPATPTLAVDDIVEINITFEGTNDEYVITNVVFVQKL